MELAHLDSGGRLGTRLFGCGRLAGSVDVVLTATVSTAAEMNLPVIALGEKAPLHKSCSGTSATLPWATADCSRAAPAGRFPLGADESAVHDRDDRDAYRSQG